MPTALMLFILVSCTGMVEKNNNKGDKIMKKKPNVIYVYADDLGRGMLSCYGQQHFQTPNIDKIINGGVNFTNAYGCHICAPARASLICGVHDAHCGKWQFTRAGIYKDYARCDLSLEQVYELIHKTGIEERSGDLFLPMVFNKAGYMTGQIGKLEWGFATTGDAIKAHGWKYHYGYYDHEMCHGFYPPFMFENGERIDIPGNLHADCGSDQYSMQTFQKQGNDIENGRAVYSQDLFDEKIYDFIKENKDNPFFLFHPSQLPHGRLSIPEVYPHLANDDRFTLSEKVYISMVLRLDDTIGKIFATLDEFGIAEDTLVIFASDNGHCSSYYTPERTGYNHGVCLDGSIIDDLHIRRTSESIGDIFDGNNGMTGGKSTNFEGGTRIPLAFYQKSKITSKTSNRIVANYDFMATMADMLGVEIDNSDKDGRSFWGEIDKAASTKDTQHDYIVYASARGPAIVTKEGYKLRAYITDNYKFGQFGAFWDELGDKVIFELYNINEDYREENNIAEQYPEKAKELQSLLLKECDGNVSNGTTQAHFVFYGYDYRNDIRKKQK